MKQFLRMFGAENYKGTRNYINTQKKFEIIRTIIYFGISFSLFISGYVATNTKLNLLTVVAIVGCLPASKSLVGAIMFLRYKSCPESDAEQIERHIGELRGLYDMVFTSYQKNFVVSHIVVQGNSICGYSADSTFPEKEFQTHIDGILKNDGFKNYTVKIFTDINKYTDRLIQLQALDADNKYINEVLATLKSVVL